MGLALYVANLGAHRCIGAALANLQTEVILDRLLLRPDSLALAVGRDAVERVGSAGEGTYPVGCRIAMHTGTKSSG
ncbi:hypothetical protein [Streptomyces sp. NBC_01408]|uniref:hypothetical protein n=1 Tax=Streptomyces sp. NBC_01408 TaxID=2903855 RepID=UPI00225B9DA1|nr:hypothetical protein [Streptomyces sp. NBC_01408]MCX4695422.1 cytochrome P450 [Streptomyces sp. NBC_01408]